MAPPLPPLHVAQRETLALRIALRAYAQPGLFVENGHAHIRKNDNLYSVLYATSTRYAITAARWKKLLERAFGGIDWHSSNGCCYHTTLRYLGPHAVGVIKKL